MVQPERLLELADIVGDFQGFTDSELVETQEPVATDGSEHVGVPETEVRHVETTVDVVVGMVRCFEREVLQRDEAGRIFPEKDFTLDFLAAELLVEHRIGHHLALLVGHEDVFSHLGAEELDAVLVMLHNHELPQARHVRR